MIEGLERPIPVRVTKELSVADEVFRGFSTDCYKVTEIMCTRLISFQKGDSKEAAALRENFF